MFPAPLGRPHPSIHLSSIPTFLSLAPSSHYLLLIALGPDARHHCRPEPRRPPRCRRAQGGHQQGPTPADVVLRRPSPARSAKPPWLHLLHRPNPSSSTPSSSVAPRALKCLVPRRRPSSRSSVALLPRPRRRFPTPLGAAPAALSIEQDQERHEDARLDRAWAAFSPLLLAHGPRGLMPASPRPSFASSSGPAPADLLKFTT